MTSFIPDAEDLAAGARRGPELDAGDSVTAALALACFAAVREWAPGVDREPLAAGAGAGRDGSRPRACESRRGGERMAWARR